MQVEQHLDSVAEWMPMDIPTLRSVLRYGLFLQKKEVLVNDNNRGTSPIKKLLSISVNLYAFMGARELTILKWAPQWFSRQPQMLARHVQSGTE